MPGATRRCGFPVSERDRPRRRPVVVAEQRHHLVGVRADDGEGLECVAGERQDAVVLEQHDRSPAPCGGRGHRARSDWFTLYGICAYGTRSGGSNIPSRKRASINRVTATSIVLLGDQALRPPPSSARGTSCRIRGRSPRCTPSAAASSGVAHDLVRPCRCRRSRRSRRRRSPRSPSRGAGCRPSRRVLAHADSPLHAVVGAHHRCHARLLHERTEGGQVGLVQVALAGCASKSWRSASGPLWTA